MKKFLILLILSMGFFNPLFGNWQHSQGNGCSAFQEDPFFNHDPKGLQTAEKIASELGKQVIRTTMTLAVDNTGAAASTGGLAAGAAAAFATSAAVAGATTYTLYILHKHKELYLPFWIQDNPLDPQNPGCITKEPPMLPGFNDNLRKARDRERLKNDLIAHLKGDTEIDEDDYVVYFKTLTDPAAIAKAKLGVYNPNFSESYIIKNNSLTMLDQSRSYSWWAKSPALADVKGEKSIAINRLIFSMPMPQDYKPIMIVAGLIAKDQIAHGFAGSPYIVVHGPVMPVVPLYYNKLRLPKWPVN